ncbi:MAG TPA: tRNA (N(6)-L-threonylcarbamoyladenosine(37)-C(2))-methylthiotransferase MtaB [Anaerolineaceae bacterium]|nr:tRNA (N(6)-L-threonylcarbamoyladenosine(37)-C(2))-methylthiotransferase MtaB [Anaerolineaceae bacterium]
MKVFLNMVGCRLNQAEIEQLALSLVEAGVEVVSDPHEADEIVINTCCVTAKASADSRKMLRHHKAHFPNARVIGTGCWVSTSKETPADQQQMLDLAYNNATKDQILLDLLEKALPQRVEFEQVRPNLGSRNRTRGFVKVQDGCDNRCSYCLTQVARGRSISKSSDNVIAYARKLQSLGIKEIVLTGVQLGSWGKDLSPRQSLSDLVRMILGKTEIPRIRLSSVEPWDVNPQLISLFENPRLCPHLHIPLQSGSDEILRKMNRPVSTDRFSEMLALIRGDKRDFAITTDIICGFPGETDELFQQSLEFIRECQFSGGHVFPFSALQGTAAFAMDGQVQHSIRRDRTAIVRQILDDSESAYARRRLGQNAEVLFEGKHKLEAEWVWQGWSEDFLKVHVSCNEDLHNLIHNVHLDELTTSGNVIGHLISECEEEASQKLNGKTS